MNYQEKNNRHRAFLLLWCALVLVYLLMRQFQWDHIVERRSQIHTVSWNIAHTWTQLSPHTTLSWAVWSWSMSDLLSFSPLSTIPQSFSRLWITSTQWLLLSSEWVAITSQAKKITRDWDSKTITGSWLQHIWLMIDTLTFYNDPGWQNVLVVMSISANKQQLLFQITYQVYRNNKQHINQIINQLTQ